MNNPEQIFYIKYADDGYITGQITQKGYDNLSSNEKKNYQSVTVDQQHLNGWGKYWNTVRYVNGVLQYPNNWPKDQSQQINELSNQLDTLQQEFKQMMEAEAQSSQSK